jgi:putative endonuclease
MPGRARDSGRQLGALGEKVARRFLKRNGFRILTKNYSCQWGEIDLICYGDGCVVFVEVKTRSQDVEADPETNVNYAKQRRLERAARHWLSVHREPDCAYRFDAVSVVLPGDSEPRVRHIVDAFVPSR